MAEAALRSALIVAVPEASSAVDEWREQTSSAKPSNGVPAHITVLFPFVPPTRLEDALTEDLRSLFARFECFSFELRTTGRFPDVLYLVPEPAERFVRLTEAVSHAYPNYPSYEGAFDTIIPHLTAAEGDADTLDRAEADVVARLPITARATEIVLLEEIEPCSARWEARARFPLRPAV
jgi:2'-5' RNA ligase